MNPTIVPARRIVRPAVEPALEIARIELAATRALWSDLGPADWRRPTACTGWRVHDVAAHVIGQIEETPRPDRLIRRVRRARRAGGTAGLLDRHNQYQVDERAGLTGEQLIAELDRWGAKALRAAARIPGPVRRRLRLSRMFPAETALLPEDSFDYLLRVLFARDPWMHRLDVALATGREPVLDAHDAAVVAQVVRDLAAAWTGPPVTVDLSGPAGGRWSLGDGDPVAVLRADAIAYMRLLSGRPVAEPPAVDGAGEAVTALRAARVVF